MNAYCRNSWIRAGIVLAIGLLAAVGLWPDPNPNPVGTGLLFLVTSWPAIICLDSSRRHDPAPVEIETA